MRKIYTEIKEWFSDKKHKLESKPLSRTDAFGLSVDKKSTTAETAIHTFIKNTLANIRTVARDGHFAHLVDFEWWMNTEHKAEVLRVLTEELNYTISYQDDLCFLITWYDRSRDIQLCAKK